MSQISNRNQWIFDKSAEILKDKNSLIHNAILTMMNKTVTIFDYNNLPETIKKKDLETILQVGGSGTWKDVKDNLYVFTAGLGGAPNPYYLPTKSIIANPALKYTAELDIDKNCVVMLNDYFYQGLMPLHNKYARLLIEAELSLKQAIINARIPAVIQADNDNTAESAKTFFEKIIKGEEYGIITTNGWDEGLKSYEFYKNSYIQEIIESIQYIKGSWYNELGLNAAFNMKREAINKYEAGINEDILGPSIDVMLDCRQDGLDKVNKMFGTNITIKLASAWEKRRKKEELEIKQMQVEAEGDSDEIKRNNDESNDPK